ncbi:MAG: adenosylcobinamide-GDP ribazoletransferase [Firmicutes bacterium HGW-Firmicutes-15]|nr:MAG: adenosylcobinamide-GDP ribazoletransferase [Firmicutes bacterium HGW-Firmicutes-15]
MRNFLLALSFLTIIPAYGNRLASEKEMAFSLYFYPLVGFVIGGLLAVTAYLAHILSLGLAGDVMVVVLWIIITGAMHMDGLMDSADGLFSGRDRERKLEIMRDSRIGAMGAVTMAAILLLKLSFLYQLPLEHKLLALFIAPALGRLVMVYAISFFPYARSESGLGNSFGAKKGKEKLVGAAVLLLLGSIAVGGWQVLLPLILTVGIMILIARWIAGRLGGLTGDNYGALCESTETVLLMVTVIILSYLAI